MPTQREPLTDCLSAPHQVRCQPPTVVDRASTDDVDGLAIERRLVALDGVHARGYQDTRGGVAGMSTALACLCTDEIGAGVDCFLDMLWVADHVHDGDAGFVELLDDCFGRDADGADEEGGFLVDDDVQQVV